MSNSILIIGESGSGKSCSLRNLEPATTFLINILGKPLPFRGASKSYTTIDKDKNPNGNMYTTIESVKIVTLLKRIDTGLPNIKTIVIDDFQYIMAAEFMKRALEKGYEKFNEIGKHAWEVLECARGLRSDLNIIFISHSDTDEKGTAKCKTIGKMVDDKVCIEGMFTIVLHAITRDRKYKFLTQNTGSSIAKSPMEMFEDLYIDNDLKIVLDKVTTYYEEELSYLDKDVPQ